MRAHGKCVCDAVSGNTKRKLTIAAGMKLESSKELMSGSDRKFEACVSVDGKPFSTAVECKRLMEKDEGAKGAHSNVKSEKRESNRKIRNQHFHVRGPDEKLSGLKFPNIRREKRKS